jgi:hypothetical protein
VNRAERIAAVAALEQVAKAARAQAAAIRDELETEARVELERDGIAPTWRTDVATLSLATSKSAVVVADPKVWLAWVSDRYPTEVETVRTVRSAWQDQFLSRRVAAGADGDVVDASTGEVVPGVRLDMGGQPIGVRVTPTTEGRKMLTAIAAGQLERIGIGS